jgi:hypothetical protein
MKNSSLVSYFWRERELFKMLAKVRHRILPHKTRHTKEEIPFARLACVCACVSLASLTFGYSVGDVWVCHVATRYALFPSVHPEEKHAVVTRSWFEHLAAAPAPPPSPLKKRRQRTSVASVASPAPTTASATCGVGTHARRTPLASPAICPRATASCTAEAPTAAACTAWARPTEERMTRPLPAAQMGDALRGGGAEAGRVQLLNPQLTHSKKRPGFHALVFKVCLSL